MKIKLTKGVRIPRSLEDACHDCETDKEIWRRGAKRKKEKLRQLTGLLLLLLLAALLLRSTCSGRGPFALKVLPGPER